MDQTGGGFHQRAGFGTSQGHQCELGQGPVPFHPGPEDPRRRRQARGEVGDTDDTGCALAGVLNRKEVHLAGRAVADEESRGRFAAEGPADQGSDQRVLFEQAGQPASDGGGSETEDLAGPPPHGDELPPLVEREDSRWVVRLTTDLREGALDLHHERPGPPAPLGQARHPEGVTASVAGELDQAVARLPAEFLRFESQDAGEADREELVPGPAGGRTEGIVGPQQATVRAGDSGPPDPVGRLAADLVSSHGCIVRACNRRPAEAFLKNS